MCHRFALIFQLSNLKNIRGWVWYTKRQISTLQFNLAIAGVLFRQSLHVLLELGGDNEDKRKAAQYQEKNHERDHLYDWHERKVSNLRHLE